MVMRPWVQEPQEAGEVGSPGAGVLGSCELPEMGAGNSTRSLFKSSTRT